MRLNSHSTSNQPGFLLLRNIKPPYSLCSFEVGHVFCIICCAGLTSLNVFPQPLRITSHTSPGGKGHAGQETNIEGRAEVFVCMCV